jgi:uncharacterized protein (TIGR02246 family)
MKLAIPALVAITLSSALASAAWAQTAAGGNEKELVALEDAWVKALMTKDSATLNKIIASDWHGQNQSGEWYDRAAMVKSFADGTDVISKASNHDVHVRFVGTDLAIVQGRDTEVSTHKGKPSSGDYSWTDVFQKRDGKWVAIASQNTPVTEK